MSTFIRSAVVAAALLGTVSAASAGSYGYDNGYGSGQGATTASADQGNSAGNGWGNGQGAKKKNDAQALFDQLRKNGK